MNESLTMSVQARLVGQSFKELIERMHERKGFAVLDIGNPERKYIAVDFTALWEDAE